MYPVICKIGVFSVYSYGLMLVAAFITVAVLTLAQARRENISPEAVFNLCFNLFIFGIIGARLFYVLENAGYYLKNPLEIIMLQRGGLSWFGGLFLGICYGLFYIKKRHLEVYRILDLLAPFIALGQAIGRIGCLLNGCCYGRPDQLIPVQIYSSLALLSIFAVVRFIQLRPHRQGQVFFAYLLLYSLKRFVIEFWRADNPVIFYRFTLFQILSAVLFIVAAVMLIKPQKSRN